MGVRRAPPRASSLPGVAQGEGAAKASEIPLESSEAACTSGTAGGKGYVLRPEVTCTTLSKACRYGGRVR